MKKLIDELGIKLIRVEGDENVCICPLCGGHKLYVNQKSGAWQCFNGCGQGYPYQLARKTTGQKPKEIFEMLEKLGLKTDRTEKAAKPVKDIGWFTQKLRLPLESELIRLCTAKQIDLETLRKLRPMTLDGDPIIGLPVHQPGTDVPVGYIRVHMDGELITLQNGKQEKYPAIGKMGLLGVDCLEGDTVLFCEGWRDMCAARTLGFTATASSGGASTWRDEWLPVFTGKNVVVIMDEDAAGVGGPLTVGGKQVMKRGAAVRAATAIKKVAASVKIVRLPFEWQETHGKDLYDFICGGAK